MKVSGFFRCRECDKVHSLAGITMISRCICDSPLFELAVNEATKEIARTLEANEKAGK